MTKAAVRQTEPDWNSVEGVRARMARCKDLKNKIRLRGYLRAFLGPNGIFDFNGLRTDAVEVERLGVLDLGIVILEDGCQFVEARRRADSALFHIFVDDTIGDDLERLPGRAGTPAGVRVTRTSHVTLLPGERPFLMPSVERELLLAEPVVARLTDERTAEGGPKLVITVGHNLRRNDGTATPAPSDDGADDPDLAQWDWALADAIQVGGLGELTFDRLALNQPAGKPGFAFHYVLVRAQDSRIYAVSLYDVEDDRRAANGGALPKRTRRAIVEDRIRDRAPATHQRGENEKAR